MKFYFTVFILLLFAFDLQSQGFNSIHTPDGVNVFAVGDSGKIYRSSNSGNGWYIYSFTSNNLKSVYTIGSDVWFAGDSGKVYKSNLNLNPISVINVGQNFTIQSIFFVSTSTGYLCGGGGKIYKTFNGGLNWSSISSAIDTLMLNSISFKDDMNGIVIGNNGKIYITTNGGVNWTLEKISTNRNLLKAKYFVNGISVVGEYGTLLLKSVIFSWAQVNTRISSDIRSVS
ncbi:MAG: YCF48-related protein, partial [bacterium]